MLNFSSTHNSAKAQQSPHETMFNLLIFPLFIKIHELFSEKSMKILQNISQC